MIFENLNYDQRKKRIKNIKEKITDNKNVYRKMN